MRVSLRQLATVPRAPTASRPAPGFDRVLGLIDFCEPSDRRIVRSQGIYGVGAELQSSRKRREGPHRRRQDMLSGGLGRTGRSKWHANLLVSREHIGWSFHRLRHSALTHAAKGGSNLPVFLARSRHAPVRSLERYARPGLGAVARPVAEAGSMALGSSDHEWWRPTG